nr:large-conductance mechanosensitive channel protein MscL [Clostridium uliginosum]
MLTEFKEFISRGNVIDMAVGVIIGGAFTTIVNSLVKDIFMPILGIIIGKINFSNLKIVLTSAGDGNVEAAIYYGSFIQNTINFLLISLVIFTFIKQMNRFRNKEEENKPKETEKLDVSLEVELLTEIRDLLKSNRNLSEIDKDNI